MISMAAYEVPDLEAAVAHVQSRGFTVTEPRRGVLPGTTVASVAPNELAGVRLQLLQYD